MKIQKVEFTQDVVEKLKEIGLDLRKRSFGEEVRGRFLQNVLAADTNIVLNAKQIEVVLNKLWKKEVEEHTLWLMEVGEEISEI